MKEDFVIKRNKNISLQNTHKKNTGESPSRAPNYADCLLRRHQIRNYVKLLGSTCPNLESEFPNAFFQLYAERVDRDVNRQIFLPISYNEEKSGRPGIVVFRRWCGRRLLVSFKVCL